MGAITGLRPWCDRTYLCKTETQTQYVIDNFGILIETGREPERVGKIEAESADREGRVVWRACGRGSLQDFKSPNGPFMRILGIEPEQERTRERV